MEWSNASKFNSFNSFKGLAYLEHYKNTVAWLDGKAKLLPPVECNLDPFAECNLKCSFCVGQRYLRNHREEVGEMRVLPQDYMWKLVLFLSQWGVKGLCFTGDTKIKLVDGTNKTFAELAQKWECDKQPFEVYSRDENNNIVPGIATEPRIISYVSEICELTTNDGNAIKCTPEHEFMLKDGSYKKAIDLNPDDSLMPLYVKDWYGYEFIKDTTYQGTTHRLFSSYWDGNMGKLKNNELVVHHVNFNKLDNTRYNLKQMDSSEHIKWHAKHCAGWRERFTIARDKWNNSPEGRRFIKMLGKSLIGKRGKYIRTDKHKEISSSTIKEFNASLNGLRIITDRIQKINYSFDGRLNSLKQLKKINNNRSIVLSNNQNPVNIQSRQLGQINKILRKLKENNLPINEENYNIYWENGLPKYKTAIKHPNFNHRIIAKKIIRLDNPIPVYCLSVGKYNNFALSTGVFVHNCISGGGEPSLHDGVVDLPAFAHDVCGMDVSFVSNGVSLKNTLIHNMMSCRWVSFSVDAADKKTYKLIKGADKFNDVIKNIKRVVDRRKMEKSNVDIAFKFLLLPENMHSIYDACVLAKELGVQDFHCRPCDYERVDIEGHKKLDIDVKKVHEQFARCHELEDESFHVYTITHKFDPEFHVKHDFKRCFATLILPILTDGNGYLCVDKKMEQKYKIGSAFPDPRQILEWWGSDAHRELIKSVNVDKCSRCTNGVYFQQIEQVVLQDKMCLSFP